MPARPEPLVQHVRRLASSSQAPADADAVLLDHFVARRDEESFAALVRRHGPMVLGVCRRVLGNHQDAEDAFQAAFLVLARKAASVRPRHALAAWLYGVARRVALKARGATHRQTRLRHPLTAPPADPHASPLDDLSARELLGIFEEELQRLPPAYRLPLILCCLEGRSQEEAAAHLGWTPGSVKGRLERGRARLHARLARRGLTLTAALIAVEASRAGSANLPAALSDSAVRAGLRFANGRAEGAAALLAQGALRGMAWGKTTLLAGLLAITLVLAGGAAVTHQGLSGDGSEPPKQPESPAARPEGELGPRADQHGDPLPVGVIARLGTLRFRGVQGCLAFSPDGKLLAAATGMQGDQVALWDVATGRTVRQLPGPGYLERLAFAPDGKRLACSRSPNECRVIDLNSGKELFTVKGIHGHFSGDGKVLVTADAFTPFQVHVWEGATGRLLRQWQAEGMIAAISLAADGKTLALSDHSDRTLAKIYDATRGTKVRSFRVTDSGPPQVVLTPDGKTLTAQGINALRLWNTADGSSTVLSKHPVPGPVVFSEGGKRLAWVGTGDGNPMRLDGNNNYLWIADRTDGNPRPVGAAVNSFGPLAFSPDGKLLAVVTHAHVVSLRNVASGKEVLTSDAHSDAVIDLAFAADGANVISRAEEVFAWQTRTGKLLARHAFLPSGHEYLTPLLPGGYQLTGERTGNPLQGRFWLRDMRTGENVLRFEGRPDVGPPTAVAAPGGRFVAVRGRAGEVCVLDVRARRLRYRLDPKETASGLKLSADGDVLVWYNRTPAGHEVRVHRHASGKALTLRDMPKTDRWVHVFDYQPCVSPDGRWLVLGVEGRLRRWDLTTGKEVSPLAGALLTTWGLCWSPDGRFLAVQGSASPDNVIDHEAQRDVRVWDVREGARLAHLTIPNFQGGLHLAFTHDGQTLVTTDLQGVVHLWEVATGKERATLKGHFPGEVGALVVRDDDRMLVSGGYDSQGLVWDLTGLMPDGRWHTIRHAPKQLRAAWQALAGGDARAAYLAMWRLAADPDGAAFLKERLRPVPRPERGEVARLIAALDADDFAERQRANRELEALAEGAADELRQALRGQPTLEARRRIDALLARLQRTPVGEQLQALRGIEALEQMESKEAREVLRQLAEGAPAARVTCEAQAACARLKMREP
jgi:RNA polymerase sigma factor (sigma-70 family)